jgi:dihydroxyacetone kinase-like protein
VDTNTQRRLIEAVTDTMIAHAEELTSLDQAIGDGDHGLNMKRGAAAVQDQLDEMACKPARCAQGRRLTLVMKSAGVRALVWDALYDLGKELPASPTHDDVVAPWPRP